MAQTAAIPYSSGGTIDYTPVSAVTVGQVVEIGSIPLIATSAIAAGAKGSLATSGVYKVPKASGTITAGDAIYWDDAGSPVTGTASSGACTGTASGNNLMGYAVFDAATGDTYTYVDLTAARRTTTIAGSVTADDITATDSSLGVGGLAAAQGGAIVITGGTSSTAGNAGGAVSLVGGTPGVTGVGGAIAITGGIGGATSGTGGAVSIAGGAGTAGNANGGAVTVKGGEPHSSGAQGTVTIEGARMAAGTTGVAITSATTLTLADSGGIFTVGQGSAYDIDLPSPTTGAGLRFLFQLVSAGANAVTVTVAGSAATFEGTIQTDAACIVATGSTLTFASGTAVLGDWIEAISTSTTKYFIRAMSSANVGITVA